MDAVTAKRIHPGTIASHPRWRGGRWRGDPAVVDDALTVESVLKEPLLVALPESHALCRRRTLRLRDLNDVPLISIPKKLHPRFYDNVYSTCIREGFRPTIAQEVTTFAEAMAMVADGVGFAFTRECYAHVNWPGVVIKNIEGQPLMIESAIVFRKELRSTVLPANCCATDDQEKTSIGARVPRESRRMTENSPLVQRHKG